VARYAWGEDYHAVIESRLRTLADTIVALAPGTVARAYVDTGPLLERDLAARAGLGWVGKNTMLLHPDLGSFFFIGVVDHGGARARYTLTGSLRQLHALSGRVSHGGLRRSLRAGRSALHRVPDDRAPGTDPGRAQAGHRQVDLRLRRLPGRLPVEPPRPRDR
jgi:hypothetical protein